MKRTVFAGVAAVCLVAAVLISYAQNVHSDIAKTVLRLHILANSDSVEDQALKLLVRDRVIEATQDLFTSAASSAEAKAAAELSLDAIRQAAEEAVVAAGYGYPVGVEVGSFGFPTKTYGGIALPAGRYDAVRVLIGGAAGQNWWCVLYPPLCFIDGATGSFSAESDAILKGSLTEREYELLTGGVQMKFKLVELFSSLFE